MPRHKQTPALSDLVTALKEKCRPPLGILLGSPREVVECLQPLPSADASCYQMDLYQGERLQQELAAAGVSAIG